ncbi:ABC transporter permease subunit [Paenibacillus albidus]|uniref:ABC transporter permease subunit n=1 Tax=Paenibacillus albidus TaxID=2041023 RepID=UPI001E4351AF|nr:ABC transporter permease subunit [Paenibacillus albidus]
MAAAVLYSLHIQTGVTCSLPFSTFLYTGFIRSGVPEEVEEAAHIDGAGLLRRFWTVVFPLLIPVTVSVIITQGIWIWNDYFFNMTFISEASQSPSPGYAWIHGRPAESDPVERAVCCLYVVRASAADCLLLPAEVFRGWTYSGFS